MLGGGVHIQRRARRATPSIPRHHNWNIVQAIPDFEANDDADAIQEAQLTEPSEVHNWPRSCPVMHLDIKNDFDLVAERKIMYALYRSWQFQFWTNVINLMGVVSTQLTANITQPAALELSFALAVILLFVYFLLYFRALYYAMRNDANVLYIWFYFLSIVWLAFYAYFALQALSLMSILAAPLAPGSMLPVKANPIFPMVVFSITIALYVFLIFQTIYFASAAFKWQVMGQAAREELYRKERRKGWLQSMLGRGGPTDDDNTGFECMLQYEHEAPEITKAEAAAAAKGGKPPKHPKRKRKAKEERVQVAGSVGCDQFAVTFGAKEPIFNQSFSIKSFFVDVVTLRRAGETEVHIRELANDERPEEDVDAMFHESSKTGESVRLLIFDFKTKVDRDKFFGKLNKFWKSAKKTGDPTHAHTLLQASRMRLLRQTRERAGNHLLTHKDWLTLLAHVGKECFKAGETIIRPNDVFSSLWYIADGSIEVKVETSGFTDPGDGNSDSDVDLDEIMFPNPPEEQEPVGSEQPGSMQQRIKGFGHTPDDVDVLKGVPGADGNCIYFNVVFDRRQMGFSFNRKKVDHQDGQPAELRNIVIKVKSGGLAEKLHVREGDELVKVDGIDIEKEDYAKARTARLVKRAQVPLETQFRRIVKNKTDLFDPIEVSSDDEAIRAAFANGTNAGPVSSAAAGAHTESVKGSVVLPTGGDETLEHEVLPEGPPLAPPSVQSTIFDDDFEIGDSDDDYDASYGGGMNAGEFVGGPGANGNAGNESMGPRRLPFDDASGRNNESLNLLELDFAEHLAEHADDDDDDDDNTSSGYDTDGNFDPIKTEDDDVDDDEQVEFVGRRVDQEGWAPPPGEQEQVYEMGQQTQLSDVGQGNVEMVTVVVDDRENVDAPLLSRASSWTSKPPVLGEFGAKDGAVEQDMDYVAAGGVTFWKGKKKIRYERLGSLDLTEQVQSHSPLSTPQVHGRRSRAKRGSHHGGKGGGRVEPISIDDIDDGNGGGRKRMNSVINVKSYAHRQGIIAKSRTFLFGKPFGYQEMRTVADFYPLDEAMEDDRKNREQAKHSAAQDSDSSDDDSIIIGSDGEMEKDFNLMFAGITTFETFGRFSSHDLIGVVPWIVNHPVSVVQLVAAEDVTLLGVSVDDLTKVFGKSPELALAFFKYLASVLGERVDRDEEFLCDKYRDEIDSSLGADDGVGPFKPREHEQLRRLLDGKVITMAAGTSHDATLRHMADARITFQSEDDMEFDCLVDTLVGVHARLSGDVVMVSGKREWFGVESINTERASFQVGKLYITTNHVCFESKARSTNVWKLARRPRLWGKIHINDIFEASRAGKDGEILTLVTDSCKLNVSCTSKHQGDYVRRLLRALRKVSAIEEAPYSLTLRPHHQQSPSAGEADPMYVVHEQQKALRTEYKMLVSALQEVFSAHDKWVLFRESRAVTLKKSQSILSACPQNTANYENTEPVGLYLVGKKSSMVIQREIYGRRIQFGEYTEGQIFGIERFLTGAPSPCTVKVSSERAQLRFCPADRAMGILRADPALAARFYQYCSLLYMLRLRGPVLSRAMNETDDFVIQHRRQQMQHGECTIL